jgi:4-hydroxymandelate oxidase
MRCRAYQTRLPGAFQYEYCGIRREVLKAVALGAKAVLVGRPYLYGLGAAGQEGVTRVITISRREFEMAMALTGRNTIQSIDR